MDKREVRELIQWLADRDALPWDKAVATGPPGIRWTLGGGEGWAVFGLDASGAFRQMIPPLLVQAAGLDEEAQSVPLSPQERDQQLSLLQQLLEIKVQLLRDQIQQRQLLQQTLPLLEGILGQLERAQDPGASEEARQAAREATKTMLQALKYSPFMAESPEPSGPDDPC